MYKIMSVREQLGIWPQRETLRLRRINGMYRKCGSQLSKNIVTDMKCNYNNINDNNNNSVAS